MADQVIDWDKPIIAVCGNDKYPVTLLHDTLDLGSKTGKSYSVSIEKAHRVRIEGDKYNKGDSWYFYGHDGTYCGGADIHIINGEIDA